MKCILEFNIIDYILIISISYLCGSIPFGVLISKIFGLNDPRKIGSGNIGSTNVWRISGKKFGLLTFFFDTIKSFVPVLIIKYLFGAPIAAFSGFCIIIGHIFPIWLKFKGGKGVAPMFGLLFAATPILAVITSIIWLILFKKTRFSSLSSLIAMASTSTLSFLYTDLYTATMYALITILIFISHRENINRLISNTEKKL